MKSFMKNNKICGKLRENGKFCGLKFAIAAAKNHDER